MSETSDLPSHLKQCGRLDVAVEAFALRAFVASSGAFSRAEGEQGRICSRHDESVVWTRLLATVLARCEPGWKAVECVRTWWEFEPAPVTQPVSVAKAMLAHGVSLPHAHTAVDRLTAAEPGYSTRLCLGRVEDASGLVRELESMGLVGLPEPAPIAVSPTWVVARIGHIDNDHGIEFLVAPFNEDPMVPEWTQAMTTRFAGLEAQWLRDQWTCREEAYATLAALMGIDSSELIARLDDECAY